jgi:hypothetical protein
MIHRVGFGSLAVCGLLAALADGAPAMAQSSAPGASPTQAAPATRLAPPAAQPTPAAPPAGQPAQAAQPTAPGGQVAPAAPAQPQVVMPDQNKILLLVRTTLLTLNDALQTGNYTVLRDVAAPSFREANSAARLAQIFGTLSQRGIDLTPVAVLAPQLTAPPSIDPKTNMLHIKGHFPGQPVQLNFEVLYQPVAGRWRVFGLSVNPATPGQAAAAEGAGKHAAPKILAKEPDKKADPKKK